MHGIIVRKINPYHTSQICSKCGHGEEGQRISQSKFKCKSCGYESNADFNAARKNANKILTEYHQKIIFLILQLIAAKLKTGFTHQLLSVSTPFFFQFFMDSVMSCLISDLSFPSAKASSL